MTAANKYHLIKRKQTNDKAIVEKNMGQSDE